MMQLSTATSRQKTGLCTRQCRICDAPAQYFYFGIIACCSCKVFFRRNATSAKKRLRCSFAGQCEINMRTRRKCVSCRLAKCFEHGMTTDRFRPPRLTRPQPNTRVDERKQRQPISPNRLSLTITQRTLLSHLYGSYNESQLLWIGQRLRNADNDLQQHPSTYKTLAEEFLASIYETTGRYLRGNADICNLSFEDRSIVLRSAADNGACMSTVFVIQHCHLYDSSRFAYMMKAKYGRVMIDLQRSATRFVDPDMIVLKVALSLFAVSEIACAYSPNVSMYAVHPPVMFHIQNKYVEVLWSYLVYKYKHHGAIQRFLNMIVWFMTIRILANHARTSIAHVNDVDSLVEQTELSLLLDDVEQVF